MIRLYLENVLPADHVLSLGETQSHYLLKVMRLKEGDEILVFNGLDGEWKAKLIDSSKKSASLQVQEQTRKQVKGQDLWLLFSPLKPKRQEFLVEKATELGVYCLCPVLCERTSIPKVNLEKMKAHVIEAAEQSGRLNIPDIKPLTPLKKLLENWPLERQLIFGDESLTAPALNTFELKEPLAFLVGPEGGFTSQEFDLLRSKGKGVTLSSNILRSETAALVGVSYLGLKTLS